MTSIPLVQTLREVRAKINAGTITLDEAAAQIGDDPNIGLTELGARDLLGKPSAEVKDEYRRIFETAELEHRYLTS
jgi:hypothetical protein